MPAAATTWFASPLSSASTKAATASHATTTRRDTDDANTPSFLESLSAATESARSSESKETAAESTPAPASRSAQPKAASTQRQKSATGSEKKKNTASKDDAETKPQDSASTESQPQDTVDANSADETAEPQAETDVPADKTDPATLIDPSLVTVTQNVVAEKMNTPPEPAEELPPETQVKADKKNDLHLPWRHYHEKPDIKTEQESPVTKESETAVAASTVQADAQPAEPVKPEGHETEKPSEPVLVAKMPDKNEPAEATKDQTSTEPDQDDQSQQETGQPHHETQTVKASKPKLQAPSQSNAHESPAAAVKPETAKQNTQANAQASAAATTIQPEIKPVQTAPATQDLASPADTTATLILDASMQQDKQTQTQAASSAHLAQQTAHDSPSETFDQIVLGLRTKIDPKNTKAEIHLNPPELGALKVSVSISDGQLTAEFTAQNQMVRDLLSNNMERLRSVLEGQGVSVDRLAVQTAPGAQVASSQPSSQQQDSNNAFDSQHDGRSNGNMGQSQQRSPQRQNSGEFASLLGQEKPLDMVA